jgi:tetratricopeptide (TPR) repeat protein
VTPVWQVGDRIENRWEILEIRQGGMGIVYIVRDREWGIVLAAKGFQDVVFARDPRIAERFRQEAEIWISLGSHPNIAQAILVKQIHDRPLIFLEFVESDLVEWIESKRLENDLLQILRFAIQFCDGITYAYSRGVKAHRDVKPSNCLVSSAAVLKVTDFGLASIWYEVENENTIQNPNERPPLPTKQPANLTSSGVGLGTPAYMAPEQFFDARGVGASADVYAFGIMLYEMLSGHLPFVGRDGLEWAQMHSTVNAPHLPKEIPEELNTLIQRCVMKDPSERFANFEEIRNQLSDLYKSLAHEDGPPRPLLNSPDSAQWRRNGIGLADLGQLEKALECFDRSLDCDPSDTATWQCKGVIWARLGKKEEGLICQERAIAADPTNAKAWGSKAVDLLDLGRLNESLECANQAVVLDPSDWSLWTIKSAVLNRLTQHQNALDSSNRALDIYAKAETAWIEKGRAFRALQRNEEASECFDFAIGINGKDKIALQLKAEVLIDLRQFEESVLHLDRALQIDPTLWSLWWDKGIALGALKKPPEQELECFSRCVELEPKLPHAWYRKGVALHDLHKIEEALECYDRALSLDPGYGDALKGKTIALKETGRAAEALAFHERLISIDPSDATAWNDKGATLCALGQSEQALASFNRALELDPNHALARHNKTVLES